LVRDTLRCHQTWPAGKHINMFFGFGENHLQMEDVWGHIGTILLNSSQFHLSISKFAMSLHLNSCTCQTLGIAKVLADGIPGPLKTARTYPVGPWVENQPPDWVLSSRLWSLGHPWINVSKGKLHRYRLYTRLSRLGTHMPLLLQICSSGRVECPQLSQFQGTIGAILVGLRLLQARNCTGFVNTNLYIYYIIL
jgi:hypothetical protein